MKKMRLNPEVKSTVGFLVIGSFTAAVLGYLINNQNLTDFGKGMLFISLIIWFISSIAYYIECNFIKK